jgi:hypothetical protein
MHLSINFVTSVTGVAESPFFYGLTVAALTFAVATVVLVMRHTNNREFVNTVFRPGLPET